MLLFTRVTHNQLETLSSHSQVTLKSVVRVTPVFGTELATDLSWLCECLTTYAQTPIQTGRATTWNVTATHKICLQTQPTWRNFMIGHDQSVARRSSWDVTGAASKFYDGTFGQPTAVRHTQATSLQKTVSRVPLCTGTCSSSTKV